MSKVSKKMAAELREQRKRMNARADQELRIVREHVLDRLSQQGAPELVDCPIVEQTIRRLHRLHALTLPDHWDKRFPRYVRDKSEQNAWARSAPTPACQFTAAQLRPLARLLVQVRMTRFMRGAPG